MPSCAGLVQQAGIPAYIAKVLLALSGQAASGCTAAPTNVRRPRTLLLPWQVLGGSNAAPDPPREFDGLYRLLDKLSMTWRPLRRY